MTRRRWVYTQCGEPLPEPVEVTADWADAPRQPLRVDVSYMDGLCATDGTDISSKRKRREYMNARGLADADDFKGEWARAAKEREQAFSTPRVREERRRDIAQAIERTRRRGR